MKGREAALLALKDIIYNDGFSNLIINNILEKEDLGKDEGLFRELTFGVLENRIYIHYILSKVSKRPIDKINPEVLIILELGIYQICFLDRIPDRAAVYEMVELSKKYTNRGSRGFINGILRNVSRKKENLLKLEGLTELEFLSIKYSHPIWMVEYFIDNFGKEFTISLLESNNKRPEFYIRVNRLRTTKKELMNKLIKKGFNVTKLKDEFILKIDNPKNMTSLDEYKNGEFTIQDYSSYLVSNILSPKKGSSVIDVSAAPGGKATHLAEIMENDGLILARDIYKNRLKLIKELYTRLGIDIIKLEKWDGKNLDLQLVNKFDYCLIDAPCSGLGTIRRSPEIKYNKTMEDIISLSKIQREILEVSKKYVKPGGYIVYSTCTVGHLENEDIINQFLKENDNYILENIEGEKYKKLYPNVDGTDGFFIAKIKRKF